MKNIILFIFGITLTSCNYAQSIKISSNPDDVQITENLLDNYQYVESYKEGLVIVTKNKKRVLSTKREKRLFHVNMMSLMILKTDLPE